MVAGFVDEISPSGNWIFFRSGEYHAEWIERQVFIDNIAEELPMDDEDEWVHPDWY